MDEEKRELIVEMLTRIGMLAEDLSAIALGSAKMSGEELDDLVLEIQREVLAMRLLGEEAASAVL